MRILIQQIIMEFTLALTSCKQHYYIMCFECYVPWNHFHVIKLSTQWPGSLWKRSHIQRHGSFPGCTVLMTVKTPALTQFKGLTHSSQSSPWANWSSNPAWEKTKGKDALGSVCVSGEEKSRNPLDVRQLPTEPPRRPSISHYLVNFESFSF